MDPDETLDGQAPPTNGSEAQFLMDEGVSVDTGDHLAPGDQMEDGQSWNPEYFYDDPNAVSQNGRPLI